MSNSLQDRVILFFIAGTKPTVAEQALIDRLVGTVRIRNVLESCVYGAATLEVCDAVAKGAGVTIPTAYNAKTDVTPTGTAGDAVIGNGSVVANVAVTGAGTTCTFTVVNGVITAIVRS